MTTGEILLNLSAEYQDAVKARGDDWGLGGGDHVTREPSVIAAEYEAALKSLIAG